MALDDHTAETDEELSFKKGTIIKWICLFMRWQINILTKGISPNLIIYYFVYLESNSGISNPSYCNPSNVTTALESFSDALLISNCIFKSLKGSVRTTLVLLTVY